MKLRPNRFWAFEDLPEPDRAAADLLAALQADGAPLLDVSAATRARETQPAIAGPGSRAGT